MTSPDDRDSNPVSTLEPPETARAPSTDTAGVSLGTATTIVLLLAAALGVGGFALSRQNPAEAAESEDEVAQSGASDSEDEASGETVADAETEEETAAADDEKTDDGKPKNPFPDTIKVPEGILDGGTGWLNAGGPISMKDLRGKIVVIDFWTYCCINCIHILPDLKYLEKKYPNELVVIGVHSAKFDNEKDTDNIRRAIQRYEIVHPVVNDSRMLIWRKFGARSWPTIAVIDPEGKFLGSLSGEGHRELLENVIDKLIDYHGEVGTLDRTPVRFDLERDKLKPTPLKFPGKVLADEKGGRLFVADTNHNRIVVSTTDGKLIDTVGSGVIGLKDGGFDEARFDHPQGMALVGNTLYVADTENHAIRTIDLEKKIVTTLAGTGEQARFRAVGGKLDDTDLNSPWALVEVDGTLYVAMAGPHQLWSHEIGSDEIKLFSGTGREDVTNGPHDEAAYAQPSGIVSDGTHLYVTDSEGSSIRKVAIDPDGEATTLVGTHDLPRGAALFEFGDIDAIGDKARLQHPIGIALHDGVVYVADSYNHKIKKVEPVLEDGKPTGDWKSTTWLGDGKAGETLKRFAEPHGLAVAGGKLIIADTNNSRLLTADLKTGAVVELTIEGLQPPVLPKTVDEDSETFALDKPFVGAEPQSIRAGEAIEFRIALNPPEGFEFNDKYPVTYKLNTKEKSPLLDPELVDQRMAATVEDAKAVVQVPLAKASGEATLMLAVSFGYCRKGAGGLCKLQTTRFHVPVTVSADGKTGTVALATPVAKPSPKPKSDKELKPSIDGDE